MPAAQIQKRAVHQLQLLAAPQLLQGDELNHVLLFCKEPAGTRCTAAANRTRKYIIWNQIIQTISVDAASLQVSDLVLET